MDELLFPVENEKAALYAENSVAGALLIEPEHVLHDIRGKVAAADFRNENAKAVYLAASELIDGGKPCDAVTILKTAVESGTPVSEEYCAECMQLTPTTVNAPEYAEIIHEAAQKRRAREIGVSLAKGDNNPVEAIGRLQELLRSQNSAILTPTEAAHKVMDFFSDAASGKTRPFLPTGYRNIDGLLSGGLVAGGLITLAARPGTGKTTVALCIADNVAAAGGKVLYISLEMTLEQLWSCRIANYTGIGRSDIYRAQVFADDRRTKEARRVFDACDTLRNRPLYVRDIPATVEDIERAARGLDGLALIVVDHIGLIKPPAGFRGSRYEIMTETAHRLKQLALSMQIPILALCQLNRQSVQRESKRPTMADLRDSGAIEEDSDCVCLLHREAMYMPEEERPKPWEVQGIYFLADKNRHGATGAVELGFCGANSRIIERRD